MTLVECRRALMSANKKLLPYEYQQVEYIESTGTQYIDTGAIPNNTVGFKIKLSLPEIYNDTYRYGCRQNGYDTRFVLATASGQAYFGFGGLVNPTIGNREIWNIKVNEPFTASLNYLNSRLANINDLDNMAIGTLSIDFTRSIIIFGRNSGGTISSSAQKVYYNQITDGDKIIRNFVPCYRKSDNIAGMYDTVNDKFYTNAGTGNFIVGGNV